jgi:tRNA threonylcarbamoyladenosine biosynthesis protein TsaE
VIELSSRKAGSIEFACRSPAATERLARRLGELLRGGEVLGLVGELGSGKTTFTRGLVAGIGGDPAQVNSPTYVLEQVYSSTLPVRHYDAYRLAGPEELVAIGFEERLAGREVLVVEWAEKVSLLLPPRRLLVELRGVSGEPEGRRIRLSGPSEPWERAFSELEKIGVKSSPGLTG